MDLYTRRATSILMIVAPVVVLVLFAIHSIVVLENALPQDTQAIIGGLGTNVGLAQVNFVLIWAALVLWIVALIKLATTMLDGAAGFSARMVITLLTGMVAVHSINMALGLAGIGASESVLAAKAAGAADLEHAAGAVAASLLTASMGVNIVADLLFYLSFLTFGVAIIQGRAFHQAFGWVSIVSASIGIINSLAGGSSPESINATVQMLTYVAGVSWSVVLGVIIIRASKPNKIKI
jgi:hypothetical protein